MTAAIDPVAHVSTAAGSAITVNERAAASARAGREAASATGARHAASTITPPTHKPAETRCTI